MRINHVTDLTDALVALFGPLAQAIDDPDSAEALLNDLGYQAPVGVAFLNEFSPLLGELIDLLAQTDDVLLSNADADYLSLFRNLIDSINDIINLINNIGTTVQTVFP